MCQVQFEQAGAVSRWLSLPAGIGSPYCLTHCCPDLPSLSCRYSHSAHLLYCQLVDPQDMIGAKSPCIYSFHVSGIQSHGSCSCWSLVTFLLPFLLHVSQRFPLVSGLEAPIQITDFNCGISFHVKSSSAALIIFVLCTVCMYSQFSLFNSFVFSSSLVSVVIPPASFFLFNFSDGLSHEYQR